MFLEEKDTTEYVVHYSYQGEVGVQRYAVYADALDHFAALKNNPALSDVKLFQECTLKSTVRMH